VWWWYIWNFGFEEAHVWCAGGMVAMHKTLPYPYAGRQLGEMVRYHRKKCNSITVSGTIRR
jgi:hypothetical protein